MLLFNCNTKESQTEPTVVENKPITALYQTERVAISAIKCLTLSRPSRLSQDSFAAVSQWLLRYFLCTILPSGLSQCRDIEHCLFPTTLLYDLILSSPCLAPAWPTDKSKSYSGSKEKFSSLLKYLWKKKTCSKLFPSWFTKKNPKPHDLWTPFYLHNRP